MMRPCCELVAVVAAGVVVAGAGCNRVLGLDETRLIDASDFEDDAFGFSTDRDRDGILDDVDSCIASIADTKLDNEGDGLTNETDTCPWGYDLTDSDGDGIYEDCDPFPSRAGDRVRCTMTFASATINRSLWRVLDGDWNLVNGSLVARTPGTLLAEASFEAVPTTSYDVVIYVSPPIAPAQEAALTFWLRADPISDGGLGCEVRGTSSATTLRLRGSDAPPSAPISQGVHRIAKLQATLVVVAPGAIPNVRCAAWFTGAASPLVVSSETSWPSGYVGVTLEATSGSWQGLQVFERDDAPAL